MGLVVVGVVHEPVDLALLMVDFALEGVGSPLLGGEVVAVVCRDCLTLREQRAIRAEQARVVRRLKRGLSLD